MKTNLSKVKKSILKIVFLTVILLLVNFLSELPQALAANNLLIMQGGVEVVPTVKEKTPTPVPNDPAPLDAEFYKKVDSVPVVDTTDVNVKTKTPVPPPVEPVSGSIKDSFSDPSDSPTGGNWKYPGQILINGQVAQVSEIAGVEVYTIPGSYLYYDAAGKVMDKSSEWTQTVATAGLTANVTIFKQIEANDGSKEYEIQSIDKNGNAVVGVINSATGGKEFLTISLGIAGSQFKVGDKMNVSLANDLGVTYHDGTMVIYTDATATADKQGLITGNLIITKVAQSPDRPDKEIPDSCTYTECECSGGNCQTVSKSSTIPCPADIRCKSCTAYNTCNSTTKTCSVSQPASMIPPNINCPSGCSTNLQCAGATRNCSWNTCSGSNLCNVSNSSVLPIDINCPIGCSGDRGCITDPPSCTPEDCADKECGYNAGCGVICLSGTCPIAEQVCENGVCGIPLCSIESFSITPVFRIIFLGGKFEATWSANSNCSSCTLSCIGNGCGKELPDSNVGTTGNEYKITPTEAGSYSYELVCSNPGNTTAPWKIGAGVGTDKLFKVIRPFWMESAAFLKMLIR